MIYLSQDSFLFPLQVLRENIQNLGQELDSVRMEEILHQTGLKALKGKTHSNKTLSGGEKQRLEIARALYHNRQFILAAKIIGRLIRICLRSRCFSQSLSKKRPSRILDIPSIIK